MRCRRVPCDHTTAKAPCSGRASRSLRSLRSLLLFLLGWGHYAAQERLCTRLCVGEGGGHCRDHSSSIVAASQIIGTTTTPTIAQAAISPSSPTKADDTKRANRATHHAAQRGALNGSVRMNSLRRRRGHIVGTQLDSRHPNTCSARSAQPITLLLHFVSSSALRRAYSASNAATRCACLWSISARQTGSRRHDV